MTPEERAEIRALVEGGEHYFGDQVVGDLLDALDVCEAERDAWRKEATEMAEFRREDEAERDAMERARDAAVRDGEWMMLDQRERREAAEAERDRAVELLRLTLLEGKENVYPYQQVRDFLASVATEEADA